MSFFLAGKLFLMFPWAHELLFYLLGCNESQPFSPIFVYGTFASHGKNQGRRRMQGRGGGHCPGQMGLRAAGDFRGLLDSLILGWYRTNAFSD